MKRYLLALFSVVAITMFVTARANDVGSDDLVRWFNRYTETFYPQENEPFWRGEQK